MTVTIVQHPETKEILSVFDDYSKAVSYANNLFDYPILGILTEHVISRNLTPKLNEKL